MNPNPEKIIILGGGLASLSTAYYLTNDINWKDNYDITLYQIGWRLGGKGASGRNSKYGQRIEEHGLHVWLGFYENAFRLMKDAYKELGRELSEPLATFEEAFKPSNFVVIQEYINGQWKPWVLDFPMNDDQPGLDVNNPSSHEKYIHFLIDFAFQYYNSTFDKISSKKNHNNIPDFIQELISSVSDIGLDIYGKILFSLLNISKNLSHHEHKSILLEGLVHFLKYFWHAIEHDIESNDEARRLWITMDLVLSNVKGIISDDILLKGFESIDDEDYKEWLTKHGASQITTESGIVQGIYSINFSGRKVHTFAAGTALKGTLKMLFDYKGSIFHKMQGGMGDVVMAPLYLLLKKRGVKFKFFHKVKNLKVSISNYGKEISEVILNKQVNLINEDYDPLVSVKRLQVWPSEPIYSQIEEGNTLKKNKFDLEDTWSSYKGVEDIVLKTGKDFDKIILGISIGSFPYIAQNLANNSESWKMMVENVKTTPTGAFQMWTFPDTSGLGWKYWKNEPPTLTSFAQPIDTWADMSDLISKEDWPADYYPGAISYFCGGIQDSVLPPISDKYPEQSYEYFRNLVISYMKENLKYLFPNILDDNDNFRWNLLVDPYNRNSESRIDSQYLRINIQPSERYVLSIKGSTKYRLKTDGTDFKNLILTGDWVLNEVLNAGCVESTVVSGIQAANVFIQNKINIIGN